MRIHDKRIGILFIAFIFIIMNLNLIDLNDSSKDFGHASAGSSWTQTSKTDFSDGIFDNVEITGTGEAAEIILEEFHNEWINRTTSNGPDPRIDQMIAPVWNTDKIVMFGGFSGIVNLNDTWIYDYSENSWTEVFPSKNPSGRWSGRMVTIYNTDKLVLFGGNDGSNRNDTWIFDLSENSWTEKTPSPSPSQRVWLGMATIWNTDKALLFSGGSSNDTWIYNLTDNSWTELSPVNSPPRTRVHALETLWGTDKIIMFGGYYDIIGENSNDTWIFDYSDNTWIKLNITHRPSKRNVFSLAHFYRTDRIMFFGDKEGGSGSDDTWIFDLSDNKWTELNLLDKPRPSKFHSVTSIYGTGETMLFGGYDGDLHNFQNTYNETWIFYSKLYHNGTYLSETYDLGLNFTFRSFSWESEVPENTSIAFQLRTADTKVLLNSTDFIGPDGTTFSFYKTSPSSIWQGHNGSRWIQYKAYLGTSELTKTPVLKNITFTYNYVPSASPVLPMNGTITNIPLPNFKWSYIDPDSISQSSFQVIIDNDADFSSIDFDSGENYSAQTQWHFPAGTTYSVIPDGTWYWKVRVKDNDNDWSPFSEPRDFIIDTKIPSSSITWPISDSYYRNLNSINGTAIDPGGGTGLNKVEVTIQRMDNDLYWNDIEWVNSESWLDVNGTSIWQYNCSSVEFKSQVQYKITSRAVDNATNVGPPDPGITFRIDLDPPWSTIDNLAEGAYLNNLFNVFGSAGDIANGSGMKAVEVSLKRNDNDNYWDGSGWIVDEAWVTVDDIDPWSYTLETVTWKSDIFYEISSRAKDNVGNIEKEITSITFMYDNKSPENLSVSINDGATYTNSTNVTLTLSAEDTGSGVSNMSFLYGGAKYSEWEDFKIEKEIELISDDGPLNVFFKVKDRADNRADAIYETIILDRKPPEKIEFDINEGEPETNSTTVILSITGEDKTSGIAKMAFSTDGVTWSDWEDFNETKSYELSKGDGTKTIYLKLMDNAGNVAGPESANIILNTSKPSSPDKIDDSKSDGEKNDLLSIMIPLLIIVIIIIVLGLFMVLKKRKTGEEPESVAVEQPEEEILPSEEADLEEQTVLEQPIPEQATEQISEDQIPDHAEPTQEELSEPEQEQLAEQAIEDEPIVDIDESQEQSEQTEPNENQVSLDETPLQESDQPAEVDTEQQQFEKDE